MCLIQRKAPREQEIRIREVRPEVSSGTWRTPSPGPRWRIWPPQWTWATSGPLPCEPPRRDMGNLWRAAAFVKRGIGLVKEKKGGPTGNHVYGCLFVCFFVCLFLCLFVFLYFVILLGGTALC